MATTLLCAELPGLALRHRGTGSDVFDRPDDGAESGMASKAAHQGPLLLMVGTE